MSRETRENTLNATAEIEAPSGLSPGRAAAFAANQELSGQWRRLRRSATAVTIFSAPAVFAALKLHGDYSTVRALVVTVIGCAAFRGLIDVIARRYIPWPTMFGEESARVKEEDVAARSRAYFWQRKFRLAFLFCALISVIWLVRLFSADAGERTWLDALGVIPGLFSTVAAFLPYLILLPLNFLILFGPLVLMGISQIKAYEPGDADWGVALDHVRGQAEAKEEVRRIVNLWQSGEAFERAGGKRERGLLMLGAPGTGKTMMSKAIATNFNAPFVSIPGSGFAQTFIGMDVVIVRYLAGKAKRMARKWGGQCIVFIDEIDAVGLRRSSLGARFESSLGPATFEDLSFHGPRGAITPSEDLILETRAWRERLFSERGPSAPLPAPIVERVHGLLNMMVPGMFGGGQLALNQLLVVMDGIGDPPFWRKFWTNKINLYLDALYVVPRRIGDTKLRLPKPKPRKEQIFFIGACNVPLENLDPALTRPGRMGRHIWFRTPTLVDRLDIFDLYITRVAHEPDLDTDKRRRELARVTNGYSPAMIEQVCSMALTLAHYNGRERFGWHDIVDAMTTLESGTAVGVEYVPEETRAVAVHEAGHAIAAHVYMEGAESTRLSIKMRGRSLGHHQALQKEERFSSWRHEEMGRLVWTLGAMAAERVFYNENSTGVGGDVMSATGRAAWMVGASAMGPEHVDLGVTFADRDREREAREKVMKRFEQIGLQIMQRTGGGGAFAADPIAGVLSDPEKRRTAAQILGQAYMKAYHLVLANKDGVSQIADALVERKELHGDEVVEMLDELKLKVPDVNLLDDASWPVI